MLLPSIVIPLVPASMVVPPVVSLTSGSCVPLSVIVPVTLNVMLSAPEMAFACVMQ